VAPAEKAVVILGNGGNWFKFQNPLDISQEDIDEKRQWVLDLVFNPEGIVKGFSGDGSTRGNIREQSEAGNPKSQYRNPKFPNTPASSI